ncbi:MAG: GGDEF domain-containing protein [Planctomycetota bacterium]
MTQRKREHGAARPLLVLGPSAMRRSVRGLLGEGRPIREAERGHGLSEAELDRASAAVLCLGSQDDPEAAAEELSLARPDLPVVIWTSTETTARDLRTELVLGPGAKIERLFDTEAGRAALPYALEKAAAVAQLIRENARLQRQLAVLLAQVKAKNEQLEEAVQTLEQIAATDPLTGLANRRSFAASMERRFAEAQRSGNELSLLAIDLDGFKPLNDAAGHHAGDILLVEAAESLLACCRRSDVAARFGGDEFVVLLPDTDLPEAVAVAQRISEVFEAAVATACGKLGYDGPLTMSQGISSMQGSQAMTSGHLLRAADQALYGSKREGRSRISVHVGPGGVVSDAVVLGEGWRASG